MAALEHLCGKGTVCGAGLKYLTKMLGRNKKKEKYKKDKENTCGTNWAQTLAGTLPF